MLQTMSQSLCSTNSFETFFSIVFKGGSYFLPQHYEIYSPHLTVSYFWIKLATIRSVRYPHNVCISSMKTSSVFHSLELEQHAQCIDKHPFSKKQPV